MRNSMLRMLLVFAACGLARQADAAIETQLVASGIPYLIGIEHAGDARLFLVRQTGQIMIYDGNAVLATPFLDVSSLITFSSERGLLGLAFHPQYSSNGYLFVYYINLSGQSVIARYHVSADTNIADPASQTILLAEDQPSYENHKGGQIRFGPDGFLYIALGDGGSGGDPQNRAQSLATVLGKLLRIDVNSGSPYIPPGNPFVLTSGARGEIWAYGLRNPWRFSFDRLTGDLFIGDVGQVLWEEIDFQPAASAGGENYGWRLMEGLHCYNPSTGCNGGSLTLPIVEYSHTLGCSVTGGFRYRGSLLTAHVGTYFFADLCTRNIWGATRNPNGTWTAARLRASGLAVTTFGEDANGELYVSHYSMNGDLYRIVPGASPLPVLTLTKSGSGTGRLTSSPTAIECGSICGAALASNSASTLTATPDPGSTFVDWSGDPDCADGAVTMSANRSCTARFGLLFTDSQLAAGVTPIKAIHITELRARIDALRQALSLSTFSWTDPVPTAGSTIVKAIHVTDMRTALHDAFVAAGRTEPAYVDPSLPAGTAIKAVHITDVRQAVWQLE